MKRETRESVVAIAAAIAVAALIALAGSQGSARVAGLPVFALCVVIAFVLQWLAFVPAYVRQTEHYFDLTGSLTYLTVAATALVLHGQPDSRALLIVALVAVWALRLGTFLFRRVRAAGSDRRFAAIKTSFARFLMTWTLQGLWVSLTFAAGLAAITATRSVPLGWIGLSGLLLWLAGFAIEVVADHQKRAFRKDPDNESRFIRRGLWAWSRHPNYFGEIVLWTGIALIAAPALRGFQLATLISPLFVYVLLTRVSGVPLLEARADRKWAGNEEYEAYKRDTPSLFLRPPRPAPP